MRPPAAPGADGTEVVMTCAVCDRSLTKDSAAAKTTHDTHEYYFCCEACEQKFEGTASTT